MEHNEHFISLRGKANKTDEKRKEKAASPATSKTFLPKSTDLPELPLPIDSVGGSPITQEPNQLGVQQMVLQNAPSSASPVNTHLSRALSKDDVSQIENGDKNSSALVKNAHGRSKNYSPNNIHFIWVGHSYLSDSGVKVIKKWVLKYKGLVCLWVDPISAPDFKNGNTLQEKLTSLNDRYAEHIGEGVLVRDISEITSFKESNAYYYFVRYEIDRLDSNYGAASDLLRYFILNEYGGFYFDIDIEPGTDSLLNISHEFNSTKKNLGEHVEKQTKQEVENFDEKDEKKGEESDNNQESTEIMNEFLYIEHKSQQENLQDEEKSINENFPSEEDERISNDSFACNKRNCLMGILTERITDVSPSSQLRHHKKLFKKNKEVKHKLAYGAKDKEYHAICLTGPGFFKRILLDQKKEGNSYKSSRMLRVKNKELNLKIFRCLEYSYTQPLVNQKTWNILFVRSTAKEVAIEKTCQAILFEASNFNILRLDDHVTNVCRSVYDTSDLDDEKSKSLIKELFERISGFNLDYSNLEVQCMYTPTTIDFLFKNKLKVHLDLENLSSIFFKILHVVLFFQVLNTYDAYDAEKKKEIKGKKVLRLLDNSELEIVMTFLNDSIKFISNYSNFLLTGEENNNPEKKKAKTAFSKFFNESRKSNNFFTTRTANSLDKVKESSEFEGCRKAKENYEELVKNLQKNWPER